MVRRALVFTVLTAWQLWAQGARGSITGVIRDSTGAVIPAATVRVTNEQTGSSVEVQSQADGVYLAPQLLPGHLQRGLVFGKAPRAVQQHRRSLARGLRARHRKW
jgi:hypothetical protein